MSRFICFLDGKFFEFSTVTETPVTTLMSEDEFVTYYHQQYGEMAADMPGPMGMFGRMDRAKQQGTSDLDDDRDVEAWLKASTRNYYAKGNPSGQTKWPGLEAFKAEWFDDAGSTEEVYVLTDRLRGAQDLEGRVQKRIEDAK